MEITNYVPCWRHRTVICYYAISNVTIRLDILDLVQLLYKSTLIDLNKT